MNFIAVWNVAFARAIIVLCFLTAIACVIHSLRSRGMYRWPPAMAALMCLWMGGLYLVYWGIQGIAIPPEYFRPAIFALVSVILALVMGYKRRES